jgi:NTE family protein
MKADAVFEGGGVRGIGIVGALSVFEGWGYTWERVAGSSVGAVIAAAIAAGYTARDMKKILMETNFSRFMDRDRLQSIPLLGKPLSFLTQTSIYSGDYVERWIFHLLMKKGIYTFGDIISNGKSPLKIIASDITKRNIIILPDDLPKYGINPSDFPIAKAVRMSISIPFYFKPVRLRHKDGISYIMDGGISCNYPIDIFDVEGVPKWPTFGFKFDGAKTSYTAMGKTDPLSVLLDISATMNYKVSVENMAEKDKVRSIIIPTGRVEITDFDISKKKSIELFKHGYKRGMDFLRSWDFDAYVSKYRSYGKETAL